MAVDKAVVRVVPASVADTEPAAREGLVPAPTGSMAVVAPAGSRAVAAGGG